MAQERGPRRRDPARKTRILGAAAELISRNGYHVVGMADIGTAAGIVGSGIYRHFPSKGSILAALLGQVMAKLGDGASAIVESAPDDRAAVTELVRNHVRVAVQDRRILQVYHREARNLPDDDLRRLRRSQRHYIEEWVAVVAPLRPDLPDAEVRVLVHAAIGSVQSILFHNSGLPVDRLSALLSGAAHAALGVEPAADTGCERVAHPEVVEELEEGA
ncbi:MULTISPECIES: TetR/AcrR family transcriptional regulator [Pseudonocardia]|uniref:HTH-type transcriptional repressor KstR2 n=2 Tax=Pseudonocardia TaxID=1847 RepID=A0A1Y2N5J8_PSEAH|nr:MULTISPECIES: TetR/AcrR family transcriptional regulator [Pseudonocardia]OSY42716.1 HTH-type transcriptional repressor KstR2 [Pseudonocardia autotrophica]TDN77293.1 TetR family transcriptional regulator [Pseudonocardia autotrophica]BBG01314.1 TetR family transcriptional regulator [Pseudonocardia autotrophica]GEC29689.1 TetR family transcriptional regulator [Pseudonocardia saturnea]